MRKLIYILLFSVVAIGISAQDKLEIVEDMREMVAIHQDTTITELLMEKVYGAESETIQIAGYRVQIYSSNAQQSAKNGAFAMKQKIEEADLQVEVYVTNNPPFWKVRLGNFRTKADAELMVEEVVRRLPELKGSTYIVPDRINVVRRNGTKK